MPMMDPQTTVCVVKRDGKEVGRVAAAAKNAPDYIQALAGDGVTVEYETDAAYCEAARMLGAFRL